MGRPRIAPPVVKGRRGAVPGRQRSELPGDVLEAMRSPEGGWGPAMAALDDRRRAFVLAMYEVPRGFGAATAAARMAGFGTPQSSALSMAVKASKLMHDHRVLAALAEEDKRRIKACAPRAVRALELLVEDPTHKGHERAISEILGRVHPIETRHTIDVVHHVDHDAEAVAQLRTLKSLGVVREKLIEIFGFSGLGRYERMLAIEDEKKGGAVIEGTAVEVKEGP
jgi:phage terminase small subunit